MSGIDNLFQEETLLSNIKIAAYFILLYEHFDYVISEEENELIFSIRKRRNTLVHELLKEIGNGLDEQDIQMIVKLLKLQQRINAWRVKQIDMPIMEIKLPKEVKPDDVMGGDDTVLESMFRILFCGEGPQFKEALEKESAKLLFKQQR